ncbi:DUF1800 domain-containing protein [Dyella monticola]|uniref:DUF1800 domain-containing protein n=1 Tax=Dyella monticola TaxID=1927958 RepID=A0A370WYM5_9GAMM|nr:DUF1800 domain-containing protein [Dyella monticola]RDS81097.1 DUF1800 domain-containing protein [Dyella monticola]
MRLIALAFLALSLSLLLAVVPIQAATTSNLNPNDIAWLHRDSFGLDTATVARYRTLGRNVLLDKQLKDELGDALPADINAQITGYEAFHTPVELVLTSLQQQQQQLRTLPDGPEKQAANKAIQAQSNQLVLQAQQFELLHAIYGQNQLKEQLVWFWLNHFSVYAGKGRVRWELADYEQNVIRPHALGRFRDLVMATLQSPAMLEFLDNAQNAKGHVNENYARELMELHTLGVNGGYTQQDVQQLALILTGVGLAPVDGKPQNFNPQMAPLVVRHGIFEFNPQRHDFSDKVLLGQTIKGRGFDEVKQAIDMIVRQPACAHFISLELARYFVSDDPPPMLVSRMARTFQRTDGDIAQVVRVMFQSQALFTQAGKKFKDPMQFVVSSVRLAFDGTPIANAQPLVGWLNQLDQPLFGRITPDGWPLDGDAWSSSGQMAKRFDIARAIGTGNNQLFTPAGSTARTGGFPMLTTRLYYQAIEPYLSSATRDALKKATSQQEWNSFLLSSPDLNYR